VAGEAWAPVGPARLGLFPGGPASPATNDTALTSIASPSEDGARSVGALSLENPLLPIVAIAAAVIGLVAFSTSGSVSVRLGKAVATAGGGVGVGSTK
jgi:hypothetical protein